MPRLSTGHRLSAIIAASVFFVSAFALTGQYYLVKRDLNAQLVALVQADMEGFAALYEQRRIIAIRQAIEFRLAQDQTSDIVLALWDRSGRLLAGNMSGVPPRITIPAEGGRAHIITLDLNGATYFLTAQTLRGGFPLIVARNTRAIEQTLTHMRRIALTTLIAIAGIGGATGVFASRWIERKVTQVNKVANRVATGDLTARLPASSSRDEFELMHHNVNHMLARIAALNRATQSLSDSIAHEMRTPLTRIQTRLSRLRSNDETAALLDEIKSTIRVFDSLLEIARAEAKEGDLTPLTPLDLSGLVGEISELYEALADSRNIRFETGISPGISILGDRNLVAQALSNLIENALKFTPERESITVSLTSNDAGHCLRVTDTGQGLSAGMEKKIFDRFSRDTAHDEVPGHGLGLALVRAIALRHGAKLSLPPCHKGFSIEISWPMIAGI